MAPWSISSRASWLSTNASSKIDCKKHVVGEKSKSTIIWTKFFWHLGESDRNIPVGT